jgi:telomerase protein component 1
MPPGRSITHLEMYSGVLKDPSAARAVFCFRNEDFVKDVPIEYQSDFLSENDDYARRLDQLKQDIRGKCPQAWILEEYPCVWKGAPDGKPMVSGLEQFGKHVLETMWNHIREYYPEQESTIPDPMAISNSYHDNFIENHSRHFIGRKGIIHQITEYVNGTTTIPLLILGEPGSGKTSLVAAFVSQYAANNSDCFVIPHFIGAAPGSTNIRNTLVRFCKELKDLFAIEEDIPETYRELKDTFLSFLKTASASAISKKRKILLVFDALNQFDDSYSPSSLDWFPEGLPSGLRIVVSTLKGEWLDNLRRREVAEISVGELSMEEREEIVKQTLWEYRKKLAPSQVYNSLYIYLLV